MNFSVKKLKALAVVVQQLFSWVLVLPFLIAISVYSYLTWSIYGFTFVFLFLALTSINLPPSELYRDWVHSWAPRNYFRSFQIVGCLDQIQDSKSMLLYHPHGMLCIGFNLGGGWAKELNRFNIHWLLSDALANLPLVRWVVNWHGTTMGVSQCRQLVEEGKNIAMTVGGFESATITQYKKHRVWIKNRKAFVKYALRYGYQLQPVYVFGESSTYWTFPYFLQLRLFLNKFAIPGVAFLANGPLPFTDVDIAVVVGEAIKLPIIKNPTQEEIDCYHQKYIDGLIDLFEKNKSQYITDFNESSGSGSLENVKLEIF